METNDLFNQKKVISLFSLIAMIGGIFFINFGDITGNVIFSQNPLSNRIHLIIPLIGIALLFCSAILAVQALKK